MNHYVIETINFFLEKKRILTREKREYIDIKTKGEISYEFEKGSQINRPSKTLLK